MNNFTSGATAAVPTVNGSKFVAVEGDLGSGVVVQWSENGTDKWVPLVSSVDEPAVLTVAQGVVYTTGAGYIQLLMIGTGDCNYAISDIRQR